MLLNRANLRLLAFGLLGCFASAFGQTFYIALFNAELRAAFDLSHGELGSIYGLATLASGLAIVQVGRWLDHVPLARFTTFSVLAYVLGCVLMALSLGPWMLGVALFLLRLTGQGLMGHIAVSSMARFFDRSRGRAVSIATLGFPLGEAILPVLIVAVMALLGWRGTWWVAAGFLLLAVLPLLIWLPRQARAADPSAQHRQDGVTRREMLGDGRFYLLLPVMLAAPFIVTGLFFHQATLAASKDWSLALLASTFVGFAITQTASSLFTGVLIDRFGARRLLQFFLIPLGLAGLMPAWLSGQWVPFVYMALIGLSAGANGALSGALWAELYGTRHIGAIRALHTAVMVLSTAASPFLLGLALDAGTGMPTLAAGLGVYALVVGPLLGGFARRNWLALPGRGVKGPDDGG